MMNKSASHDNKYMSGDKFNGLKNYLKFKYKILYKILKEL